MNRRRAVRNIGLTALATTLGCSKESIAPIVPEDPDEFQGKAWRDGTAKTALEDAGLTIRFSNDPSRRDLDDYMIEVNSIAPPGDGSWKSTAWSSPAVASSTTTFRWARAGGAISPSVGKAKGSPKAPLRICSRPSTNAHSHLFIDLIKLLSADKSLIIKCLFYPPIK